MTQSCSKTESWAFVRAPHRCFPRIPHPGGAPPPSRTAGLSQVTAIYASAAATNQTAEGSFFFPWKIPGNFHANIYSGDFFQGLVELQEISCDQKCRKSFVLAPQEKLFNQMSVIPTVIKAPAPPHTEAPRASLREKTVESTSRRADR